MDRDALPLTSISQAVYRYSNYDTPFWVRANTKDGRWHHAGDGPTQYLSLSTDGAWADLIRSENLHTEDEVATVRITLWEARIDAGTVVDYSDFDRAADAGFPPDGLIDDAWDRCQTEGKRLREMGFAGVLAPSAALPGAFSLTFFGPRVAIRWDATARLASAVPAQILTVGSPPVGLLGRVRFRGDRHAGYEAYAETVQQPKDER
jgi:hypothetical protein